MIIATAFLPGVGAMIAFVQVVLIDLALAGDNAVAVGLLAASLPEAQRKKAIFLGLSAAVILLIGFALIATRLLDLIGLLLAGGCLLLFVCWKMWRELRDQHPAIAPNGTTADADARPAAPAKSIWHAMVQILIADLTMSLDNVLAVAGAARAHPAVLIVGLGLSITLMGLVASWIADLLNRHRWIAYAGLAIVLYVALHMVWEGGLQIARAVS